MVHHFKLQIPISEKLKESLKQKAGEIGFSSINDLARLVLTNIANGTLNISFNFKLTSHQTSEDEELEKILKEGLVEYKAGKAKALDFSKSIHNQLMED